MCKETSVSSAAVRDILTDLASCWIQGTVHSYIELSGIQQKQKHSYLIHTWSDKLSRVPLQIGHCHLCSEGHLKLNLQFLCFCAHCTLIRVNSSLIKQKLSNQLNNKYGVCMDPSKLRFINKFSLTVCFQIFCGISPWPKGRVRACQCRFYFPRKFDLHIFESSMCNK